MNDDLNLPDMSEPSRHRRAPPALRLAERSVEYLSDSELLSLLLRGGRGRSEPVRLARSLLEEHGSLSAIAAADPRELQRIDGLGPANAAALHGAFALAIRINRERVSEGVEMSSPEAVADFMREECRPLRTERFQVLLLNVRNRLLRRETIVSGLVDRAPIHAREVFRPAIVANCSRILLVHNHPSGDPSPSPQDIDSTRKLVEAGRIIGIEVLDHLILGLRTEHRSRDYLSLKENNLM